MGMGNNLRGNGNDPIPVGINSTAVWQNLAFCVKYKHRVSELQKWNRVTGHRVSDGRVGSVIELICCLGFSSAVYM